MDKENKQYDELWVQGLVQELTNHDYKEATKSISGEQLKENEDHYARLYISLHTQYTELVMTYSKWQIEKESHQ